MSKKILIINNERDEDDFGWIPHIQEAISKIENVSFEIKHHSKVSEEIIQCVKPNLVLLTGRVTHHWSLKEILNSYKSELELLKKIEIPTLGICAGHQLLGISYGSEFGKMIESEEDILEEGYTDIEIVKQAPLFKRLKENFRCMELHRDEVKELPSEFEILASTEMCKIQAMKHNKKNLYGLQFHPEYYNDENPDGKIILENFLNMAYVY